ncbi:MAG: hypothetical protein ACTSP7_13810, partial [Candidatus Heimdallarchaeota archaeon]
MKTGVQVDGVILTPFNPLSFAIGLEASFVARTYAGDQKHMKEMIKKAIQHKGYALLDILQPCVSFNKLNTYKWFKDRVYYLEESHDPKDKLEAIKRASEVEKRINQLLKRIMIYIKNQKYHYTKEKEILKHSLRSFFRSHAFPFFIHQENHGMVRT